MTEHDHQYDVGWVCPECGLARKEDGYDPCLGRLPGVLFACCGHGGLTSSQGYVYFENGVSIHFNGRAQIIHADEDTLQRSLELKAFQEGT